MPRQRGPPAAALCLLAAASISSLLLALPLASAASSTASRVSGAAKGGRWPAAGWELEAGAAPLWSDVLQCLRGLLDLLVSLGTGYLLLRGGLLFGHLVYLLPALCALAWPRP